jgi:hypothetical protein
MSDRTRVSRRQILLSGGLAATVPLLASARPAATLVRRPDVAGAPPPEQVHVQFGADAATQIAVSSRRPRGAATRQRWTPATAPCT